MALVALVAGCGGDDEPTGPIPVDSKPIQRDAYVEPLGAAVEAAHALEDDAYRELLITGFTSITPENAMKWAVIQPERGEFDFEEADTLVEFARTRSSGTSSCRSGSRRATGRLPSSRRCCVTTSAPSRAGTAAASTSGTS